MLTSGGITISSVSAIPLLLLLIHKCSLVFLYLPLEVQCWPSEPSLKLKLACEIISYAITLCSMSLSAAMLSSLPLTVGYLSIWASLSLSLSLTRREQCNCHSTDLLLHQLTPIYLHRLTSVSRPRPFTYMSWASTKVWSLPNENLKRGDEAMRWSAQMWLKGGFILQHKGTRGYI